MTDFEAGRVPLLDPATGRFPTRFLPGELDQALTELRAELAELRTRITELEGRP